MCVCIMLHYNINFQIEHIREKLNKITPSTWQCTLRSEVDTPRNGGACLLGVTTTCHLSLEAPSELVLFSSAGVGDNADTEKVRIFLVN